ncbi:MAG: hypothetical protein ABIQ15_17915 [Nocardioides sp.]
MNELGNQPKPTTEPPERFPGGVDSIADEGKYGDIPDTPAIPDLDTAKNAALDHSSPDELSEPEESQDAPTSDGASEPDRESPA